MMNRSSCRRMPIVSALVCTRTAVTPITGTAVGTDAARREPTRGRRCGAAVLTGNLALAVALYGTYGLTRGGAVWVLLLGPARRLGVDSLGLRMLQRMGAARRLSAAVLVAVGVAITLSSGARSCDSCGWRSPRVGTVGLTSSSIS